jgi:hypothetical protein
MDDSGEPSISQYLKQISQVPGLSAEQEAELARQIEVGLFAEPGR